jgi:hypothetical protein
VEAHNNESEQVEVTDDDTILMATVLSAFNASPQLKPGLPSIRERIKDYIDDIINNDQAAPSLPELLEKFGDCRTHNITTMLSIMLVSLMKGKLSSAGTKKAIFVEEVELMLKASAKRPLRKLLKCLNG